MRSSIRSLAIVTAASLFAAPAIAERVHLTASQMSDAETACRSGLPLIPVEVDTGIETGQYALPLKGESGEFNSALILDKQALDALPECRARVEQADFLPERPTRHTALS
ncbi:MAG TPA: hypothetical protein EYG02_12240 [Henriciella marina]|uniref:hypothetical protein n=1 Tax=Henriciella sp. TaxID=1968823 RepID=UPI0017B1EE55|nr:hypothetical protein [Henriciella sp.]HIG23054.1 hypothetical protein [Henriciella sp.]HIK65781.1 hypothetical protein [Henriciella marina]